MEFFQINNGDIFGRLTVVNKLDEKYKKRTSWLCKCSCGKELIVAERYLKIGSVISCGCGRKEILIGQKFGRWTVLYELPTVRKHTYWLCRCDCGSEKRIGSVSLKEGTCKSCGCARDDFNKKNNKVINGSVLRECTSCKKLKNMGNFRLTKSKRLHLSGICNDCKRLQLNKWRSTDKGYVSLRISTNKRRFVKIENIDSFRVGKIKSEFIQRGLGNPCPHCKIIMEGSWDHSRNKNYPTLGHIIPLGKMGKHDISNLQIECWGCNSKKCWLGNLTSSEFNTWLQLPAGQNYLEQRDGARIL